jgi:hypothetical protein
MDDEQASELVTSIGGFSLHAGTVLATKPAGEAVPVYHAATDKVN